MQRYFGIIGVVAAVAFFSAARSEAYLVAAAKPLDKIVEEADLIVKATAVATRETSDTWFGKVLGFNVYATELRVVSAIKGTVPPAQTIIFDHYARAKQPPFAPSYAPQHYEFEPGKTYIVFAGKTDKSGVFRQLWKSHTTKEDQGVLRAADDKPVTTTTVCAVFWNELKNLLAHNDSADVLYAVRQMDEMSNPYAWTNLADFPRDKVLEVLAPLMSSKNGEVARRAILAVGSASPYREGGEAPFWLTTVGGRKFPGLSQRDAAVNNTDARKYWTELTAIADGSPSATIRAVAIRALGRCEEPKTFDAIGRWIKDPAPEVQQAAAILLSDFPGEASQRLLRDLAKDTNPQVVVGAARAIGFGQFDALLPLLNDLFHSTNEEVRTAAAMSLLSFAPAKAETVWKANRNDPDFKSLFVNALAETDPKPYLDDLCEIIEKNLEPKNFWGGQIPSFTSWKILFEFLQSQPREALTSGKFDKCFDALEAGRVHSSSEPRDLYEFYLKNGMKDRAAKFREQCKKSVSFDMEYYFKDVDKRMGIGKAE